MPVARVTTVIALGTVNNNIMNGNLLEFLPRNSMNNYYAVQSATGLIMDIVSGTDTIGLAMTPNIRATLNTDQDLLGTDTGLKGDHQIIPVNNPTAGALTHDFQLTTLNV